MKTLRKERRSKRLPAKHILMLTILGPSGNEVVKEVVKTVELSRHGARIRGRRALEPDWRGVLLELKSLRQAPFRVAWQDKAPAGQGYLDTGVEFLGDFEFWEQTFSNENKEPVHAITIQNDVVSPKELLQELLDSPAFEARESGRLLKEIWCGLVEQLEERNFFTRAELVASLRKIAEL
jgi:hypothetical protein